MVASFGPTDRSTSLRPWLRDSPFGRKSSQVGSPIRLPEKKELGPKSSQEGSRMDGEGDRGISLSSYRGRGFLTFAVLWRWSLVNAAKQERPRHDEATELSKFVMVSAKEDKRKNHLLVLPTPHSVNPIGFRAQKPKDTLLF